jgi:hypothetical protein
VTLTPALRKLALTLHVMVSVGWLGAVAGFLALAVVGLTGDDTQVVRGAYVGMQLVTRWVIVPASIAALVTGVVQAIGTPWGLFRHYWVLVKLLLTVASTGLLLLHTQPIAFLAERARDAAIVGGDFRRVRIQLVADAAAALIVLIATTVLSVYKPRGMTPYGQRRQRAESGTASPQAS